MELALPEEFVDQIKKSDIIFLKGGHTQQLLSVLNDTATITITDVNSNVVLSVSGNLSHGNQQAHNP